ncbi:MAG: hypothetical protein H6581_23305 [Bacteroidia bacterium]|nr:hypothetical protein [Bacteroidia bacterium]
MRHPFIKKTICWFLCFLVIFHAFMWTEAYALSEGPAQPEAMQFEPVDTTDLVNIPTGDLAYSLPLINVPGPGGGYPISLSYHSGVGPNQEATWVGLGWSLNPGSINRTVVGYPDDFKGGSVRATTKGIDFNYGLGIGVSLGAIGLNLGLDNHKGLSIGGSASAYGSSISANSTGSVSASASLMNTPVALRGGTGANGSPYGEVALTQGGAGLGYGLTDGNITAGNAYLGQVSMRTRGSGGGSVASMSNGTTSTASGKVFQDNSAFTVPFLSEAITLSGYFNRWYIDQRLSNSAYGHLRASDYLSDYGSLGYYDHNPKFDKSAKEDWVFPGQDMFSVQAQGLAGVFKGFQEEGYMLVNFEDLGEHHEFPDLRKGKDESFQDGGLASKKNEKNNFTDINGLSESGAYSFRFLGETGANMIGYDGTNPWGRDFESLEPGGVTPSRLRGGDPNERVDHRQGGRKIRSFSNSRTGEIQVVHIQDVDGKIYEFGQPINNYCSYTQSTRKAGETTVKSEHKMSSPYAAQWMITGIKGPDYVDSNRDGQINDGDAGYWVKFSYRKLIKFRTWRSPFSGEAPDFINPGSLKTYSTGISDRFFLTTIETASHKAVFSADQSRKDDRSAPFDENLEMAGMPVEYSPTLSQITATNVFFDAGTGSKGWMIKGNWVQHFNDANSTDEVLRLYTPQDKNHLSYSKDELDPAVFIPGSSPEDVGFTYFHPKFHKTNTPAYPTLARNAFVRVGNMGKRQTYFNGGNALTSIKLFKKSQPAEPVKAIVFTYDYSLCPGTPNSEASLASGDATNGGKLTLRQVQTFGRNGVQMKSAPIPPHKFYYANNDAPGTGLNPAFNDSDWDQWGSYRDPAGGTDRGDQSHNTPRTKARADQASAWSLTKIQTPTGGSIGIEYESDDFYQAGQHFDLEAVTTPEPVLNTLYDVPLTRLGKTETIKVPALGFKATFPAANGNATSLTCDGAMWDHYLPKAGQWMILIERKIDLPVESTMGTPTNQYSVSPVLRMYFRKIKSVLKDSGGTQITFEGNFPIPWGSAWQDVSVLMPPPATYGGGIRVKNLRLNDGLNTYITHYDYTENAHSSGTTPLLPQVSNYLHTEQSLTLEDLARIPNYQGTQNITVKKGFGGLFATETDGFQPLMALYPGYKKLFTNAGPGVLYSTVGVTQIDEAGHPLRGKSEFNFFTCADFPIQMEDKFNGDKDLIRYSDRSGIYGQLKSQIVYDQYWNESAGAYRFRKVTEKTNEFTFGDQAQGKFALRSRQQTTIPGDINQKPLGAIQQKYAFRYQDNQAGTDKEVKTNRRKVDAAFFNPIKTGEKTISYFYPDETKKEKSVRVSQSKRDFLFDVCTATPLATFSENFPHHLITESRPAFYQYGDQFEMSNQLVAVCENYTYDVGYTDPGPLLTAYSFPAKDRLNGKITTWQSYSFGTGTFDKFYRQNDEYEYNTSFNTQVIPPFSQWNYAGDEFESPLQAGPYRMVGNITRYDDFSRVIEEVGRDGKYMCAAYSNQHGTPVALGFNTRHDEMVFWDFEEGECGNNCTTNAFTGSKALNARLISTATALPVSMPAGNFQLSLRVLRPAPGLKLFAKIEGGKTALVQEISIPAGTKNTWTRAETAFTYKPQGNTARKITFYVEGSSGKPLDIPSITLDHVRIKPAGARMRTFTFDPVLDVLISLCSENETLSFYEYDEYGNLRLGKDEDGNILTRYSQHFSGQ